MKRQRGRGRRPGGGHQHNNYNNPNRQLESTGPENTKVRGSAPMVFERYQQYARDAASSGDRVLSENYLQHADHYFRLWRAMQPAMPPPQSDRFGGDSELDGDEDGVEGVEEGEAVSVAEGDQGAAEYPQEREQRGFDKDGDPRRRRGRRNRFRQGGGGMEGAPDGDGGEAGGRPEGDSQHRERDEGGDFRRDREAVRRDRPPREERRSREPEESRDAGPEGFSSGPKPAFLRGD
ncbi:MAG: DUF4167 domain-containing protein [Hyphomonadaceae bacterium]|nr:DUF4167 domain-containing protein [Hyphomonadaceae bacterium]